MRYLVIITTLVLLLTTPSFSMNDTTFNEFMESREIVATFYFKKNSETLTLEELKRVSAALNELRGLQSNGRMIRVEGFSSPDGDREKNFELSFYRAKTVADVLDAGGLPSEVALTGYGDLKADQDNSTQERRVEIASYIKPVGLKKVKLAKKRAPKVAVVPDEKFEFLEYQEIDSYKVDQAIRRKVDDKAKSIAEQIRKLEEELAPGISKNKNFSSEEELERGYTQWRRSVDPDYSPKVTHVIRRDDIPRYGLSQTKEKLDKDAPKLGKAKDADSDLQRGYSQAEEKATQSAPKLGQAKDIKKDLQRGYSRTEAERAKDSPKLGQTDDKSKEIQRGYSQLEEKAAADKPKLGRVKNVKDDELKHGYSQLEEDKSKDAPKLGRVKDTDSELQSGYSHVEEETVEDEPKLGHAENVKDAELQRGYSQADETETKDAQKLRQAKIQDNELQRSLTEWVESIEESRAQSALLWPADTPPTIDDEAVDVTMILPGEYTPRIDALMIEQAIMDKLGVAPTASSGSVTKFEPKEEEVAVQ